MTKRDFVLELIAAISLGAMFAFTVYELEKSEEKN